jgi:excisionase family DNA binding protein
LLAPAAAPSPLTARQVALRVGVELKTVHNWVSRGLLRHFRTPGRHLRFQLVDVDEFLRQQGYPKPRKSAFPKHLAIVPPRRRASLARAFGGRHVTWQADPLRALVAAGRERPGVIVIDAGCLDGLDPGGCVQALADELPGSVLVWLGSSRPPRSVSGKLRHCSSVKSLVGLFRANGFEPRR